VKVLGLAVAVALLRCVRRADAPRDGGTPVPIVMLSRLAASYRRGGDIIVAGRRAGQA